MTFVIEYWQAGGPLMIPLFFISMLIWYAMLAILPALTEAVRSARSLQDRLHGLANHDVNRALNAWLSSRSTRDCIARVVQYGFLEASESVGKQDRFAEASGAELARLRKHQKLLRACVAAAPLLGLLGTVQGMVATFTALSGRGAVSMEMLSGGISQALITTQVGLVIALPGLIGAHAIERRLKELSDSFERLESHFTAAGVRERATQTLHRRMASHKKRDEVLV